MTALPMPEKISVRSYPTIKDSSDALELGDNYQQIIETGLNPQHQEWQIAWVAMQRADVLSVLSVLDTVRTVTPMTWTEPLYGVEKHFRLVKDSRKITPLGAGLWEISASLREVFVP